MSWNKSVDELRQAVIDRMRSHGIIKAEITMSGHGDEGDIQEMVAFTSTGEELEPLHVPYDVEQALKDFLYYAANVNFDGDGCQADLTVDLSKFDGQAFALKIWEYETVAIEQPTQYL